VADYKVGIELLLASNGEAVLGVLGKCLLGIHGQVKDLQGGFGTLKLAIAGAFAIGGAVALLDVMSKMTKKGAELENVMYRLRTAGFSPAESAAVKANATRVANQFRNLTEGDLVKLTAETSMVYGDPRVAMANLPTAAAYLSAIKYRNPGDPEGAAATAEDQIFKILRSTEMRGIAQNPGEVGKALTAVLRGQEAFGDDNFDPNTVFQSVKYGRLASRYLSDRFLYGPGMIAAQEMGGSNYGNSLNQIMQAVVGGHMTKAALEEWERIGIIDPKKVIAAHGRGSGAGFNLGNAVPQSGMLQSDPDKWFQSVLAPAIDRATHGDTAGRDQILRTLFPRATAQQAAEMLAYQMGPGGRFYKDSQRLDQAMTPAQAIAAAKGNLQTNAEDLNTAFSRLATNLGDPMARALSKFYGALSGAATKAANASGQHPGAAAMVDVGLGAAAAAMAAYGASAFWKIAQGLLGRLGLSGAEAAAAKDLPEMASGLKNLSGVLGDLGPAAAVFSKAGVAGLGLAALLTWVEVFPRAVVGLLHALGVDTSNVGSSVIPHARGYQGNLRNVPGAHAGQTWSRGAGWHTPGLNVHPSSYSGGGVKLQGNLYVDGKPLARIVASNMARDMNTNRSSGAGFDGSANYTPVGLVSV